MYLQDMTDKYVFVTLLSHNFLSNAVNNSYHKVVVSNSLNLQSVL